MLNWCLYLNCYRITHIINNSKQKVKESQTNFEKKETFPVSLVKRVMYYEIRMARPPRIELGSQASEAYVISIGPRAHMKCGLLFRSTDAGTSMSFKYVTALMIIS